MEADKNYERAATLMGAAEGFLRSTSGLSVFFPELSHLHDRCRAKLSKLLGKHRFESILRRGRNLRFDAAVDFALEEKAANKAETAIQPLTKREMQVAGLVAQGLTNKEIAARLVVSLRTAQGHVEHILVKLNFNSRTQIAAWVAETQRPDGHTQF